MSGYTVITADRFGDKAWQRPHDYRFAATTHWVPIVLSELPKLVPAFPLGFVKLGDRYVLGAIMSRHPGENVFVSSDGKWISHHIPALLRGYPFRLLRIDGREEPVLGLDEASAAVVDAGSGEPFFDANGDPSAAIKDVLVFLTQWERNRALTQRAVDCANECGLIRKWPVSAGEQEQGGQAAVDGLYRIDERALAALDDEYWSLLRAAGSVPLCYGQLYSMEQLRLLDAAEKLQDRLKQVGSKQQQVATDLGLQLGSEDQSLNFQW